MLMPLMSFNRAARNLGGNRAMESPMLASVGSSKLRFSTNCCIVSALGQPFGLPSFCPTQSRPSQRHTAMLMAWSTTSASRCCDSSNSRRKSVSVIFGHLCRTIGTAARIHLWRSSRSISLSWKPSTYDIQQGCANWLKMSSAIKTLFRYRNGEVKAQNIGDGIPEAPSRSWFQEVKRKIARSGNAHEHLSASVAPLSAANGPIRTTAPISIPQQSEVRDTEPTGIELNPVSRPPLLEASRTNDKALVQDNLDTTDAQATFQPSGAAQETIPANAEGTAAPDSGDTPAMPPEQKAQTPKPSSKSVSRRDLNTAVRNYVHALAQTSSATMDDIAPASTQISAVEQESKIRDRNPKQKQNVSTEPASRENGESQMEISAKRNMHQILEHHLRGYERVQIAILVDIEDYKGSRRICVKCFDGAVHKADEIETILSRNGTSLRGSPYVVHRRGEIKVFGYKGPDNGHIDDPPAIGPESPSDDLIQPFSDTPYWTRESTMVEIFCGDERDGNITGAPIRIATTRRDGSLAVSLWTCGGIIKVGETEYGLTTAHPLVLSSSFRPRDPLLEMLSNDDADMMKDLIVGDGPFGGKADFFSAEHHPEKYWQAIGKVSHYALAKMGSVPSNNDWLLFELPKDRSMWNDYGSHSMWNDPWESTIRNDMGNTKSSRHALAVFSARGTLAAHILEGTAFLILGNSPFEVLKIGLREPLRKDACMQHGRYRANDSQVPVTLAPGLCAAVSSSE